MKAWPAHFSVALSTIFAVQLFELLSQPDSLCGIAGASGNFALHGNTAVFYSINIPDVGDCISIYVRQEDGSWKLKRERAFSATIFGGGTLFRDLAVFGNSVIAGYLDTSLNQFVRAYILESQRRDSSF